MLEQSDRVDRPFLPIWRGALADESGVTFTHELTASDRSYLEWVAIHHRPRRAALAFSAEIGRRLGDALGPGVFYRTPVSP
jgi:hypothetical protein